jgi:hypothetical protein
MNEEIDQSKVFGKIDLVGGETVFSPGLFPKRMVIPGIIDIDEASRAPAFALIMFQRPFDRREFVPYESKDAEVIKAHPWNCIFLSDNTAGNGDDIDQYVASNVLDASTINRIQLFIKKDYMGRRDERRIIKKFSPDMSTDEVTALAKFSYLMHTGFKKGDIQSAFSPRNLKTICGAYNDGMSLQVAVTYNFINRLNKSETADVQESFRACFATEVTGECINCGKPTTEGHSTEMPLLGWHICQTCERRADELNRLLEEGIEVTYSDGTTEIIGDYDEQID